MNLHRIGDPATHVTRRLSRQPAFTKEALKATSLSDFCTSGCYLEAATVTGSLFRVGGNKICLTNVQCSVIDKFPVVLIVRFFRIRLLL